MLIFVYSGQCGVHGYSPQQQQDMACADVCSVRQHQSFRAGLGRSFYNAQDMACADVCSVRQHQSFRAGLGRSFYNVQDMACADVCSVQQHQSSELDLVDPSIMYKTWHVLMCVVSATSKLQSWTW